MSLESILITLLIGAIAGWLASVLFSRWGFGLPFNIILGVLGGLLGAWLFPQLGISLGDGLLGSILTGTVGASIILLLIFTMQRIGFVPRRHE